MLALQLFVNRTRLGKAMRATAQDAEAARMMGVDVDRVIVIAFFLGSALAGAAALIFGLYYNYTSFIIGYTAGLRAFTAAVLGGIGSVPGAMVGGVADRADREPRRPIDRGALDRRDHLLDPGSRPRLRADRPVRPRHPDEIVIWREVGVAKSARGRSAPAWHALAPRLARAPRPPGASRPGYRGGAVVPDRQPERCRHRFGGQRAGLRRPGARPQHRRRLRRAFRSRLRRVFCDRRLCLRRRQPHGNCSRPGAASGSPSNGSTSSPAFMQPAATSFISRSRSG